MHSRCLGYNVKSNHNHSVGLSRSEMVSNSTNSRKVLHNVNIIALHTLMKTACLRIELHACLLWVQYNKENRHCAFKDVASLEEAKKKPLATVTMTQLSNRMTGVVFFNGINLHIYTQQPRISFDITACTCNLLLQGPFSSECTFRNACRFIKLYLLLLQFGIDGFGILQLLFPRK